MDKLVGEPAFQPLKDQEAATEEVVNILKRANKNGQKVRVIGAGHSSFPLIETKDSLVLLENFEGIHLMIKKTARRYHWHRHNGEGSQQSSARNWQGGSQHGRC